MRATKGLIPLLLSITLHVGIIALVPWADLAASTEGQSPARPVPMIRVRLGEKPVATLAKASAGAPARSEPKRNVSPKTPPQEQPKAQPKPKTPPKKNPTTKKPAASEKQASDSNTLAEKPRETARNSGQDSAEEPARNPDGESAATGGDSLLGSGGTGSREGASTGEQGAGSSAIVDVSQLSITKKVEAEYPSLSRKRREQGKVTLLVDIAGGRVIACQIETSSGVAALDESAMRAVRQWRFSETDPVRARVRFAFSLNP